MAEVASAYVTLIPSAKGFAGGIQRQIGGDLTRAGKQGGTDFGTGMKSGVAGIATKVFAPLAIAAAGLGLGKILSDSITSGSDLQQSVGGAGAVFKGQFSKIEDSAEAAAKQLGLSKNEYLELATALGAGLKNKGVKDFAGQTQSLITTGADLAAQFGGTTSEAVNALSSALRGEMDPIERYGVALNDAALKAEALRQGTYDGKGPLTDQAKAQAALGLITKQTADAQGAFARESDTYAGSQSRLAASWEDMKAEIGTALLPALTDLSQWFLKEGLPAIKEFGGWVKDELWPALKDGWETVRPGLEKAGDIIMNAFGGESGTAVKDFGTFLTDKVIPAAAEFANVALPAIATHLGLVIDSLQFAKDAVLFFTDAVTSVLTTVLGVFISVEETAADMLRALSKVPGFGWAADAADALQGVADKAKGIKSALENIPKSTTTTVNFKVNGTGKVTLANGVKVDVGQFKARAKGGPVGPGEPYIVGEKGPELIVPRYHGNVIPNHQLGAGSSAVGDGSASAIRDARMARMIANELREVDLAVGVSEVDRSLQKRARSSVLSSPGR